MPFDPGLAERLEKLVASRFADTGVLAETRMFGGFGYTLNGNMCVGIHKDTLIVRVGAEKAAEIIGEPGVRAMDLTGKVMKAWATIEPEALARDAGLERYCRMAIGFVSKLPAK